MTTDNVGRMPAGSCTGRRRSAVSVRLCWSWPEAGVARTRVAVTWRLLQEIGQRHHRVVVDRDGVAVERQQFLDRDELEVAQQLPEPRLRLREVEVMPEAAQE